MSIRWSGELIDLFAPGAYARTAGGNLEWPLPVPWVAWSLNADNGGGGGKAVWDIESAQDAPSYLIKRVEGIVYDPNGEPVGTLDKSVGEKTGFGEPLTCEFEVHWDDGFYVRATLHLVRL